MRLTTLVRLLPMPALGIITFMILNSCGPAETNRENLVEGLMEEHPEMFSSVLDNPDAYEVQIIYTQIDRDSLNNPHFTEYTFNVDEDHYFYPASTVKMPVAFLALEKLNALGIPGLNRRTVMLTDSAYSGQAAVHSDSNRTDGRPSIEQYIREVFVVSDNEAFNRLYEFVGPGEIRSKLRAKGFDHSRIVHRLSIPLTEDENRHTNPIRFVQGDSLIHAQPARFYEGPLDNEQRIPKGNGYIANDTLVNEPMNFGGKNFISLPELNDMLRRVLFPDAYPEEQRFGLTADDYDFLRKSMSELPREAGLLLYDKVEDYDTYCKFLLYGSDSTVKIPEHIRIFNKIGLAYGYTTDAAYIVDFRNNVEFMLSATILTNANGIFNDGVYEYEETAFPFLKNLGEIIYQYELQRKREYEPVLSDFRFNYNGRN